MEGIVDSWKALTVQQAATSTTLVTAYNSPTAQAWPAVIPVSRNKKGQQQALGHVQLMQ